MEYKIVPLSEPQVNELEVQLDAFDKEHDAYRLNGRISIGIEKDGAIVAGLNACVTAFKILYICTVFVREDFRRKGLGRALMSHVEREARKLGVNTIRLDTFGFQGAAFYQALGYEVVGHYANETDHYDEYFFVKRLL